MAPTPKEWEIIGWISNSVRANLKIGELTTSVVYGTGEWHVTFSAILSKHIFDEHLHCSLICEPRIGMDRMAELIAGSLNGALRKLVAQSHAEGKPQSSHGIVNHAMERTQSRR